MASSLIGHFVSDEAQLDIRADGFTLKLACGDASIAGKLDADARRSFIATGTYENAGGGPQLVDEDGAGHPARFGGHLVGNRLTLLITPATGKPHTLQLERGRRTKMVRCL